MVPLRKLRTDQLLKNVELLHDKGLLSDTQLDSYRELCAAEEKTNTSMCATCEKLTTQYTANGKRAKDSKDEAKTKAAAQRQAQKALDKHLAEAQHSRVDNWPLLRGSLLGERKGNDDTDDSDNDDDEESAGATSDSDSDAEMVDTGIQAEPVGMVYRGARTQRNHDTATLKSGDLVALLSRDPAVCDPPFWVATVGKVTATQFEAKWMQTGDVYDQYWFTGASDMQDIKATTVLLFGFKFKDGNRLDADTLRQLGADKRLSPWKLPTFEQIVERRKRNKRSAKQSKHSKKRAKRQRS